MTFPRFQLRTDLDRILEMQSRREIAEKMAARGFASPLGGAGLAQLGEPAPNLTEGER